MMRAQHGPAPVRLRRQRKKGWNLQAASRAANGLPGAAVMRPGPWGNPFAIGVWARVGEIGEGLRFATLAPEIAKYDPRFTPVVDAAQAVALYEIMIARHGLPRGAANLAGLNLFCGCRLCSRHATRGKPFAEFCPDCAPCHADTLGARVAAMTCEEVG